MNWNCYKNEHQVKRTTVEVKQILELKVEVEEGFLEWSEQKMYYEREIPGSKVIANRTNSSQNFAPNNNIWPTINTTWESKIVFELILTLVAIKFLQSSDTRSQPKLSQVELS